MSAWLCLQWWYTAGWGWVVRRTIVERVVWSAEAFSMKDLVNTLFAPYRQTYSGKVRGGIEAYFRGLVDNLISRVIGFLVRLVLLFTGSLLCLLAFVAGTIAVALWAFVPLAPLIGLGLFAAGWTL